MSSECHAPEWTRFLDQSGVLSGAWLLIPRPYAVSEIEVEGFQAMTRAASTKKRKAMRARIILRAAEGQAIRRGSFENAPVLTAAFERFTRDWNTGATPFAGIKTADEILAKAVRKPQADFGAGH